MLHKLRGYLDAKPGWKLSQPNPFSLEIKRWKLPENFNGQDLATALLIIHQRENQVSLCSLHTIVILISSSLFMISVSSALRVLV